MKKEMLSGERSCSLDYAVKKLRSHCNKKNIQGMTRFGINSKNALGVSMPVLRTLSREIGRNHDLAKRLWKTKIHEARILAGLIADPLSADEKLMEQWVKDFDSWDVCDQVVMNFFDKTPFAYRKAAEWSERKEEYIRRAGFAMMASLAVHDKSAKDLAFLNFFPYLLKASRDERNFVKKAVNWAIRQIGKRNLNLNKKAIKLSKEIQKLGSKSAKWIAADAIRELERKKSINSLKK